MTSSRTYRRGTVEYLGVIVTADVELDTQQVAVAFDELGPWTPAAWVGDPGTTRTARVLLGTQDAPFPEASRASVFVRLTDNPEIPVIRAGSISVI